VIGFDDISSAAKATPPLTTIRQPLAAIGERATRLLVARVEGDRLSQLANRMDAELVVRCTTAPPER